MPKKPTGGRYAPKSEWDKAIRIGKGEYKELTTASEQSKYIESKQRNIAKIRKIQSEYSRPSEEGRSESYKKRKYARAGAKQGETKALYSGFKIHMSKESRGGVLASGVNGNRPISSKLREEMRAAIKNYLNKYRSPILNALKQHQLNSVGRGIFYPEVEKNGQTYYNHTASRAFSGDTPANLSGELANSYTSRVERGPASEVLTFTATAEHAQYLVDHGRRLFNAMNAGQEAGRLGIFNPSTAKAELWAMFRLGINARYQYFK